MIVQVPRADSLLARVFGRNCQLFAVPVHVYNYSQRNLIQLFTQHGFEVWKIRQIPAVLSFVESFSLKLCGKEGEIKGRLWLVLAGLGLLFELVSTIFFKSGIFEVWARRR
jgi:hypothetical protein